MKRTETLEQALNRVLADYIEPDLKGLRRTTDSHTKHLTGSRLLGEIFVLKSLTANTEDMKQMNERLANRLEEIRKITYGR